MSACDYADEKFAARYAADGPAQFVPGYHFMHQMAVQLIAESVSDEAAELLVLGAGGGLEIARFGSAKPHWQFTGVDPSPEMLNQARGTVREAGVEGRVTWVQGYVADAPMRPFDAATCLLTLHFMEDNGEKLDALVNIKARLKKGAPLILVDLCLDQSADDFDLHRDRYARFALDSGAAEELVEQTRGRLKDVLATVSAERNVALLRESGFSGIELFYAGLSWRGWIAFA
ncbi:MAG: methyltransferase [Acidobacteriota bacterium]